MNNKNSNQVLQDLVPPFEYLRQIIKDYVIPNLGYSQHPWFVNEKELSQNIKKIEELLNIEE